MTRPSSILFVFVILASSCASSSKPPGIDEVTLRSDDRAIVVQANGETFARILVEPDARVAVTTLRATGGRDVLRGFPLAPRPNESVDHPEQIGMWTAHASVDDENLWLGPGGARAVEHVVRMVETNVAAIDLRLEWRGGDGRLLCNESRTYTFRTEGARRTIDVVHRMTATGGGLVFDDVKDGFFALRLADEFKVSAANESARAFCSTGARGVELWGVRARWAANGAVVRSGGGLPSEVTVCVLDHPDNVQHPPSWHARPYGLVAANPFGRMAYGGSFEDSAAYEMDGFETLTLRYRVVVARERLEFNDVDALWAEYAAPRDRDRPRAR